MPLPAYYHQATDPNFRLLAGYTSPPRVGVVASIETSGQLRVNLDDPDGGQALAWPLNGFEYAVDDIVYVLFVADNPESAIILGARSPQPALDPLITKTIQARDGKVGIGDATDPSHELHVENTGNNTSLRVSDGTTDFFLQAGPTLGSRIILDDNRTADDKRWDITTGITHGGLVVRNNDDNVNLLTLLTTGLGILTDAPQGPLHIHDGTGGLLFVSKTGINGTAQTLIPNGAGDVTLGVIGWHMTAAGGTPSAGTLGPLGLSSTQNVTIGANTYQYAVSAAGALTVRRTAGTAAGSCALLLLWL